MSIFFSTFVPEIKKEIGMMRRIGHILCLVFCCVCLSAQDHARAQERTLEQDMLAWPILDGPAEYIGGTRALWQFLHDSITYPQEAKEKHLEGRVVVRFRVAKDGHVDSVRVHQSSGYEPFDAEAVRVISMLPPWKPAWRYSPQGRIYMASTYTVPIHFKFPETATPNP